MIAKADRRTPAETQIAQLLNALKRSRAADEKRFSVVQLIDALGTSSRILVVLVFSVLNMIPGPPGFGGTMAAAIIAISLTIVLDVPLRVHPFIGKRRMSVRVLMKMTKLMARIARFVGQLSRPRLSILATPLARRALAGFIILVSLPMLLPIPFINAVPNVGICILALGMINRDGLGVIVGIIVSLFGLGIAGLAIWGAYQLAMTALGAAA